MTGFRVAYGGAQALLDIKPDITTLGKIVGGGMPIGAYGARREIMEHILPAGKVFQAGTLSGNPVATAAGIATLRELRDHPPYERLETLAARLEAGLASAAEKAGIAHTITRVGSMLTLFFSPHKPTDWDTASHSDTSRYAKYFWGLLDRGVYSPRYLDGIPTRSASEGNQRTIKVCPARKESAATSLATTRSAAGMPPPVKTMHKLPAQGQRVAVFLDDHASGATLGYYGTFVGARLGPGLTYTYLVSVPFLGRVIAVDSLDVFVCPIEQPAAEEPAQYRPDLAPVMVRFLDPLKSDNDEIKGFYRVGEQDWEHFMFVKTAISHIRYEYTAPVEGPELKEGLLYYEVPRQARLDRQFVIRSLTEFLGHMIDWS
jgi:hypothetical protein